MSGICGAISLGHPPRAFAPEILERMLQALADRGALHAGTSEPEGVALGERRSAGGEPQDVHRLGTNEDGRVTAVVDGVILNRSELRSQLKGKGHAFRTRCTGELISHLYEESGNSFPQRIRGDFAFAVWDARTRRAVLGRDRMGAKPLYYALREDLVLFASELKGVLASGLVEADLDYEAIDAYLTLGYVPSPRTLLSSVSKLLPAHCLVVDSRGVRTERYWEYPVPSLEPPHGTLDRHAEELLDVLDEAVRVRLDGQAGALLSGGLDSSLIVALMTRHTTDRVKTFSAGFAEPGQANELSEARSVAGVFGAEHRQLELSLAHDTTELTELVWRLDEPIADLGWVGLFALAGLVGEHTAVCFAGEGADGLLAGLPVHRTARIAEAWDRMPLPARRAGRQLLALGSERAKRGARILGAPGAIERYLIANEQLERGLRAQMLRGKVAALDGATAPRVVADRLGGLVADPLTSLIYIDQQLVDADCSLQTLDRAASIDGLEMCLPFYDHRVIEYAATIPNRFKVRRLKTKYVLRHAARGLVPDSVIDGRKVGFLYNSLAAWVRAQVPGAISDYLLAPSPRYAEFLDRGRIEQLVADHADSDQPRHSTFLFSILLLEIWLAAYLPRTLGASAPPPAELRQN
jgi:asparagine synthase (glutamine-hydrolysing)